MRGGGLRLGHPPGDGLLELRQVLVGNRSLGRLRALARPRSWLARGRPVRRRRGLSRHRRGPGGHGPLDVGLHDPPARPRAGERRQVEPLLARHPSCQRRCLHPPVPAGGRGGGLGRRPHGGLRRFPLRGVLGWRRFARGLRFAFRRRAVAGRLLPCLAHPRDHLADRQRVALGGQGLDQGPAGGRLVDHVGLVGLDLDQLLAERDLVAGRLQPAQDRALLHRVREPRHDDVLGHYYSAPSSVANAALTTCSGCGMAACSMRFA